MMQNAKLFCLTIILFTLTLQQTFAQVSGISYTLSPSADYSFWNERAGLDNTLFVGGKVGFGFGEFFELRGNYMQSLNAKTNFSRFQLPNYSDSLFVARDVKIARWGGDVKANIGKGKLLPFVTLGTGIQSIQLDTFDSNKQIYISAGAGIKFSLADRYTLVLEAKNTAYRYNAFNLLTGEDVATFDLNGEDFTTENLNNWSIGASIQFYLGGRKPGELSALDKAYFDSFAGGFSSVAGTIEPMAGKIQFHESLPYRDTWMTGVNAGIDLGPFVGLRGFYWRGLEDGELTSFDKIAMYGGEVRMRLNTATGLVPYITLGGGNIDVQEEYIGRSMMLDTTTVIAEAKNKGFAMGGLGITLPLSDNFQVFGSARAILTSGTPTDDFQAPDQVQTSFMYSAGLRFTLGKKSKNPDQLVSGKIDEALAVQKVENDTKTEELKKRYETKALELEQELNTALEKEDYNKAAKLKKEQQKAKEVVAEIAARQEETAASQMTGRANKTMVNTPSGFQGGEIRMTPAEFENIIDEILDGMNGNGNISPMIRRQMTPNNGMNGEQPIIGSEINRRMGELEKQIGKIETRQDKLEETLSEELKNQFKDFSNQLNTTLQKLNDKIDNNTQTDTRMRESEGSDPSIISTPQQEKTTTPTQENNEKGNQKEDNQKMGGLFTLPNPSSNVAKKQGLKEKSIFRKMSYAGTSGFAGFNIGGSNTANFGIRGHYPIGQKQNFEFVPETFFGVGSTSSFGLSGNLLASVKVKQLNALRPYIGAGLGLMKIEQNEADEFRGALNIILGTYLNVWKGRLYVDLAGRNLFKNNQLVAGYRLPF